MLQYREDNVVLQYREDNVVLQYREDKVVLQYRKLAWLQGAPSRFEAEVSA